MVYKLHLNEAVKKKKKDLRLVGGGKGGDFWIKWFKLISQVMPY